MYQYDEFNRLKKEIYPNGRAIEFTYDAAFRLASTKDPFGNVNAVEYDGEGRLESLTHSALGTATYQYAGPDRRLARQTSGNGASEEWSYDPQRRLTGFAVKDGSGVPINTHQWGYDELQRKSDISVAAPSLPDAGVWDLAYDNNNRLSAENLRSQPTGPTVSGSSYQYDANGNRMLLVDTSLPGSPLRQFTYGSGNRETSVSSLGGPALAPVQYDFKGNVTVRPPLDGSAPYNYTWDVYDRMKSASRAGEPGATYVYDAMGRLIRKQTTVAGRAETSYIYWQGLNRLAEETVKGDDMFSFKPDTEAGATPAENGWAALIAGDTMEYATDTGRPGKVLRLTRNNPSFFGGFFINGDSPDPYDPLNPNDVAFNAPAQAMSLWMKGNSTIPPGGGGFLLFAKLSNGTLANLSFIFGEGQDYYNPPLQPGDTAGYGYYLGAGLTDGTWKFLDINAEAYLHQFTPDLDVVKIDALIAAPGGGTLPITLELDDITLRSVASTTQKTYQVNPTAVIGSYVGAAEIDAAAPAPNAKWYYHYNDLGTVLATTDAAGWQEGVYEPQFFGAYKKIAGVRPDAQGLQSKFFDADAGFYYFQARWYDSERGRWMSEDPLLRNHVVLRYGYSPPPSIVYNNYKFVGNLPYAHTDSTGMCPDFDTCMKYCVSTAMIYASIFCIPANVGYIACMAAALTVASATCGATCAITT